MEEVKEERERGREPYNDSPPLNPVQGDELPYLELYLRQNHVGPITAGRRMRGRLGYSIRHLALFIAPRSLNPPVGLKKIDFY